MDRIYELAKGLGKLYDERVNGFFIGKAVLNIYYDYEEKMASIKSEVTKDGQLYKRCSAYIVDNDKKCISCDITLIRPRNNSKLKDDYISIEDKKQLLAKVSYKEVEEFINITGDKNTLHDKGHLIVPGMILLNYIDNYLKDRKIEFSKLEIRFLRPVYVNEEISINIDRDTISIISINKIVIKGVFK